LMKFSIKDNPLKAPAYALESSRSEVEAIRCPDTNELINRSEDIARQVLVVQDGSEPVTDILGIDGHVLARHFRSGE
jgi:hypothetical protein